MLQGQGKDGEGPRPETDCASRHRAPRRPERSGADSARCAEARPTPLPKLNFTLLGLGPTRRSPLHESPPAALPPARSSLSDTVKEGEVRWQPDLAAEADPSLETDTGSSAADSQVDTLHALDRVECRFAPSHAAISGRARAQRSHPLWTGAVLCMLSAVASFLWVAMQTPRTPSADVDALTERPEQPFSKEELAVPLRSPEGADLPGAQAANADTAAPGAAEQPVSRAARAAPLAQRSRAVLARQKALRVKKSLAARPKRKKKKRRAAPSPF